MQLSNFIITKKNYMTQVFFENRTFNNYIPNPNFYIISYNIDKLADVSAE